jgi:hypothetical protein
MRYFKAFCVAVGVSVTAAMIPSGVSAQGEKCDRACLADIMTRYLNAMVAHDPSALPVAPNVKFTEDTVQMKLGEIETMVVRNREEPRRSRSLQPRRTPRA